jgi:hypothetical protein
MSFRASLGEKKTPFLGKDEGNMSDLVMKMGIAMVVITMNWDVGRL